MKKFFTFVMACALVMSANAVPSLIKAEKAQSAEHVTNLKSLRAEIAKQNNRMPVVSASSAKVVAAKKDVVLDTEVSFATASYYEGQWEIDFYNADTALLGYIMYEGGDETHLVASNVEVDGESNVAILVNGTDTLEAISGTFSITYVSTTGGHPYYLVQSEEMSSDEEAMSISATFPVILAYDYLYYMFCYEYGYYCDEYEIELEDAPFELTGETINVTLNDLIWVDHTSDQGWWQLYGFSADSTYYITLSNADEVSQAAGSYTLDMMDEDYTLFYINLKQVKIHELTFTLTLDVDGNPHIAGTLIGKDGVVYVLDLGGAPKEIIPSDNQITLSYVNGYVNVTTTNSDTYFFVLETKEDYDGYQDDFSQASLNDEVDGWIATYVYYGYLDYVTFSGNESFAVTDMFSTAPETGDYVALAAGINAEGDRNTEAVYLLFTYTVGDAVENVSVDTKAVKRLVNGELLIERNGELFNVQGIRK
jgi:hypothetical protein